MSESRNLEVEVKFFVPDLAGFGENLGKIGGVLIKPRVYERNVRFDTADQRLQRALSLLRLRQDTAVKVTFKAPAPEQFQSEAKVREEIEVEVADFEQMALIFERLGFAPRQIYEKYRTTYQLEEVEIVLDELPFGNFIELEGAEAGLKTAVSHLNLAWEQRIVTNYLTLMARLKERYQLPFDDLTFANFENLSFSIEAVLDGGAL